MRVASEYLELVAAPGIPSLTPPQEKQGRETHTRQEGKHHLCTHEAGDAQCILDSTTHRIVHF